MSPRIAVSEAVGSFAESKETAKKLRLQTIIPAIQSGESVELDFAGVTLGTQSFIHALIADAVRLENPDGLDHLVFKNCNDGIRSIIEVVVSYCQDDWSAPELDE
jgi:hypothetical protein